MKRWQPHVPLLGIFCLALAVRVLYNLTVGKNYVAGVDAQAYQKIAFNIVREHCFCLNPYMPTVGRAPLWPGVIAAFDILFGPSNLYVRLFCAWLVQGHAYWCTCLPERYSINRLLSWQEYWQAFTRGFLFMTAGYTLNHSIPSCS